MENLRITLRQLQIFVAVARSASTTNAEIALSQSATSSAIKGLERTMTQPLFHRIGKRLELNENGRCLLPRAMAVLDNAAGIQLMLGESMSPLEQARELRIGASTTVGNYLLPRLLGSIYAPDSGTLPKLSHGGVVIGNTGAICQAVARFDLDVGLIEGPSHGAELEVLPWVTDHLVIVASTRTRLSDHVPGRTVSLKSLRQATWLLREPGSGTREATDGLLLPQLGGYRHSIEIGSSEAIKRLVSEDAGIACLSSWVVEELVEAGRLQILSTTFKNLSRPCFIIHHRARQPTRAFNHLLAILSASPATYK